MPNNYFQFKQFTVQQDKCAMKVCTDACLFGAWVADKIAPMLVADQHAATIFPQILDVVGRRPTTAIENILDIGTGTGLLSLMVAQKSNDKITGVEMDEAASEQAEQNAKASPWRDRISIHNTTIQAYNPNTKSDLVISNPPFFEGDLKSPNTQRNLAMHSEGLSGEELISNIKRLIKPNGNFALLLPFSRTDYFEKLASQTGFFLNEKVMVRQSEKHPPFRVMLWFGAAETRASNKEITIKIGGNYSNEFVGLLKDYYLYL